MDSDGTVISDSEPESSQPLPSSSASAAPSLFPTLAKAMKDAARAEKEQKKAEKSRKKSVAQVVQEDVLVLSSDDDEAEPPKPSTSHYFPSATTSKRRRVPSGTPAGEGWPSLSRSAARPRSLSISSTESTSGANNRSRPFVSALVMLRSTPTQPSDAEVEEGGSKSKEKKAKKEPKKRPTIKKSTSALAPDKQTSATKRGKKAVAPAASMSSIEIVGGGAAAQAEDDEDDRMSIASTSSSTSLPAPSKWKEQFTFGSTSSRGSLTGASTSAAPRPPSRAPSFDRFRAVGAAKEDEEGEVKPKTRKKPWEDLESLIKQHRPKAAKLVSDSKAKKVVKRVKAESAEEADDDDDVLILDADVEEDTAFKPLPNSASRPRSRSDDLKKPHLPSFAQNPPPIECKPSLTSTALDRKPNTKPSDRKPLSFLPEPVALPPPDRIRPLTSCPSCSAAWAPSKSLPTRQNHLRLCATKEAHSAASLAWLVDSAILELAEVAEEARREREESLSLFDRAVGKGEGAGGWKEVTAVGSEGTNEGGAYFRKTKEVQDELNKARKKVAVEKVVKLAKEIRGERRAMAVVEQAHEKKEEEAVEAAEEGFEEGGMPVATGRLRPDSSTQRAAVASRAGEVLGILPPSAALPAPLPPPTTTTAAAAAVLPADDDMLDLSTLSSPPPPTQGFEQSYLAARCQSDGTAEAVVMPSKHSRRSFGSDETGDGGVGKSLWRTAAGKEEEEGTLNRVVVSSVRPLRPLRPLPFSPTSPDRSELEN